MGLWSVKVRTHTWLSGSGREGSWWRCSAERWLLGMEAGHGIGGRAAAGTAGEAANQPALLGLQVGQRTWPSPGRGAITAPALLLKDVRGPAPQDAGQ